jgi:hypothetical protein
MDALRRRKKSWTRMSTPTRIITATPIKGFSDSL